MAFITEKTLFIHVQKTGGMTVRRVLYRATPLGRESGDAEGERHIGLPQLRASHPGIEAGRLSFGFVRHPVSWIVSRWAFAVVTGFPMQMQHRGSAAALWLAACWHDRFEEFAARTLDRYPGIATQTMFSMLGMWSGKSVDRIGKTENLIGDLTAILDAAGEHYTLDNDCWRNGTDRTIRDAVIVSDKLKARIMRAESQLCERFGYE
jgi:hypothetical protein